MATRWLDGEAVFVLLATGLPNTKLQAGKGREAVVRSGLREKFRRVRLGGFASGGLGGSSSGMKRE